MVAILRFLDLFKNIFQGLGIDYGGMRKILEIKLLLDSRRVSSIIQEEASKDKERNYFYRSLILYFFFGIMMVAFLSLGSNYLFQMALIFGLFMFFMLTTLISDYSSVLLDLRDKDIILSKPINNKTLNAAKVIHITIYTSLITLAMMGPSLLFGLIRRGPVFFLIFLIQIILINLFLIVVTGLLYLAILRFFDGERLRDIINYVQIGLTIAITIGYQLVGRVFEIKALQAIEFLPKWWSIILPPIWFAAPFELILNGNTSTSILLNSLMALVIPFLAIISYIKLMPSFESSLQKLSALGGYRKEERFSNKLAKIVCKDKQERIFYKFTNNMVKNEREFKLRVYPSIGFGLVFPLIMLFNYSRGRNLTDIANSKGYFTLYFTAIYLPNLLQFLACSANYKGAWIYRIMPIGDYEPILKGAVKSIFINLFTPVVLINSIIYLILFDFKILDQLLIVYLNLILSTLLTFRIFKKDLPFSRAFHTIQRRNGFFKILLVMMGIGLLAAIHYQANKIKFGPYILMALQLITIIMASKFIFKVQLDA